VVDEQGVEERRSRSPTGGMRRPGITVSLLAAVVHATRGFESFPLRHFLPTDKPSLILMDELMNYVSRNRRSGLPRSCGPDRAGPN